MRILSLLTLILLSTSCQTNMNISISNSLKTNKIPSGSGIVMLNNKYYIIGDDSPFLYVINQNFELLEKIDLNLNFNKDDFKNNRIKKSKKPDFEAFEKISDQELVIFGSGSKSPQRDIFIRILLKNNTIISIENYQISEFYNYLKNLPIYFNSELNIEAAAYKNETLYLFNRNKNIIIYYNYSDFLDYIKNSKPIPNIQTQSFILPKINNMEAGFSGANSFQNQNKILFTASVENTNDAYNDGEILGSLLGIITLQDKNPSPIIKTCFIQNTTELLKVESITINQEISNNITNLTLITDDDLGNSILINGILKH